METRHKLKDGRTVFITIDEDDYSVAVTSVPGREKLGGMTFRVIEGDRNMPDQLVLTWAYLDEAGPSYKRQGIGRRCLELVRDVSGIRITAADHDGHRRDDGGQLTGDAPEFVARMRGEGLIY